MSSYRSFLSAIACLLLLGGCFEDEAIITLNSDGSGTFSQKLTLSERLITAASDDNTSSDLPPITIDDVRSEIGSALNITDIRETGLPDGGKVIEIEGTFDKPEAFFLSEFCRETLRVRLASADTGKAAIHHTMESSDDSSPGPTLTQLYGLAKGLYVSRTVRLPTPIERTNGQLSDDNRAVQWEMDLRHQQGLEKTRAFVEGADKGKGIAVFDASALTFSLPLQVETTAESTASGQEDTAASSSLAATSDPNLFQADAAWLSVNKIRTADGEMEMSDFQIGIELRWNEGVNPTRCEPAVLTSARDDTGKDLLTDSRQMSRQINDFERRNRKKELTRELALPSENARTLKAISGYVEVVAEVETRQILIDDIHSLVNAESIGHEILDGLNFKILSIEQNGMRIHIDGGRNTIVSIEPLRKDGNSVQQRGYSGWENTYHYQFADDLSDVNQCRLEVVVAEKTVNVPFSLAEIALP